MAKIAPKTVIPQTAKVDNGLPRCEHVKANAPFTLVHHHCWTYTQNEKVPGFEEGAWLPDTGTIRHEPGANGVTKSGNPAAAILGAQTKGSIPILNGDRRLGEYANYLGSYDVKGGGTMYVLQGVRYALVRGGRAAIPTPDLKWIYAFRQQLQTSGIVPPMQEEYLGERIHTLKSRLNLYAKQAANGVIPEEAYQRKSREFESTVKAWEAAFDRQFGGNEDEATLIAPAATAVDPTLTHLAEPEAKPKRRTTSKRAS